MARVRAGSASTFQPAPRNQIASLQAFLTQGLAPDRGVTRRDRSGLRNQARRAVDALAHKRFDAVLDAVLAAAIPKTGCNLPRKSDSPVGFAQKQRAALDVIAPPSNAAVTFRLPRLAKSRES